ncbi:hypothetical protein KOM00_02400 [Geomonas sp. Red69]|uniref:Uncharacterized protein n=1 Tax=Geomonas diazotrophica TaxID=2843197 RepID=A0ABX8JLH0_9BACT|nr:MULTISPECIES: hypothetical protein [Geomonas]MBU5635575.1 hypothetical protein [Geomonas diazotrophica]QWV98182.1 hypothetical protein KP005_02495 [Geomonas nitrogeniifigens]QXE87311.1 hypothetical protein KP003_02575 [Geomonas nitrogeniifigens]
MKRVHSEICDTTERKEQRVRVKNTKTGEIGLSYGCTIEGDTVQVELPDGSLDSWPEDDCEMIS